MEQGVLEMNPFAFKHGVINDILYHIVDFLHIIRDSSLGRIFPEYYENSYGDLMVINWSQNRPLCPPWRKISKKEYRIKEKKYNEKTSRNA